MTDSNHGNSRRAFLQMGLTGAAAGLLAGGLDLALPPGGAQRRLTPDAALNELMEGNKRSLPIA